MPLPSVVAMTVPRSPATLSRLLCVSSERARPGLGHPAPLTAARLSSGVGRAAALLWGREHAGTQVEMCDPGQERGIMALSTCLLWEMQRGFLTFLPLFSSFSHFSYFIILFFLNIFSNSVCFAFPFPLSFSVFFNLCHTPASLCWFPAGLFEHSLSTFAANSLPPRSSSIA